MVLYYGWTGTYYGGFEAYLSADVRFLGYRSHVTYPAGCRAVVQLLVLLRSRLVSITSQRLDFHC